MFPVTMRARLRARISQVHPGFPEHLHRTGRCGIACMGNLSLVSAPRSASKRRPGPFGAEAEGCVLSKQRRVSFRCRATVSSSHRHLLRQCRRLWQFRDRLMQCGAVPLKAAQNKDREVQTFAVSTSGSTIGAPEVLLRDNSCSESFTGSPKSCHWVLVRCLVFSPGRQPDLSAETSQPSCTVPSCLASSLPSRTWMTIDCLTVVCGAVL